MILQVIVSLIPVEMGERALHRTQPTIHVVVLLVSLVKTAVQISSSVHLAPVLTAEHVWRGMGQRLHAYVPWILLELSAQHAFLVSFFLHIIQFKYTLLHKFVCNIASYCTSGRGISQAKASENAAHTRV